MNEVERKAIPSDIWSETRVGSFSCFKVKTFEPKGEFGWHVHDEYDELFVCISGKFILKLRDRDISMEKGNSYLVPKGIEHTTVSVEKPMAVVIRSFERLRSQLD